ncbi:MAG: tetratricopeptide repeat protein [bacterium]
MKNKKILFSICLIVIITAVTFSSALKNGFTLWDDNVYITGNNLIKEFSLKNIQKIFTTFILGNYHPLTLLSFSIEYSMFDANPHMYHLTNIILHILNCIIVFWLVLMLSKRTSVALVTTLLFGLHPLRIESVAWISARKDLLCALFFLTSLVFYLYYQKRKHLKYFYLSLATFACSLLSKGMGVTLPLVLVLCDYFLRRQFNRKIFFEKIPYFLMALIFGSITLVARLTYESTLHENIFSVFDIILINIHRLVFYYLMRMVAPFNLSLLNPQTASNLPLSFAVFVIIALLIIASLISIVIFSMRYTRQLLFGCLFFIITLSPILSVVILGYSADRFTYIPSIGFFYAVGYAFVYFYNRKLKHRKSVRTIVLVALCGLIGTLSFVTWKGCHVWENSVSLESYFIQNYPREPIFYRNRGVAYEECGDYESAIADFSKALKIRPGYADCYLRRGNVYFTKGLYDTAVYDFGRAIEIDPYFATAYYNRGVVYLKIGEHNKAISDFTRAIKIKPDYSDAYVNRGIIYGLSGRYNQAISDFTQAIGIRPNFVEAYNNRGFAYSQIGKYELAITDFSRVIAINPNFEEAYNNRGFAYSKIGKYEAAIADFSQALRLNPNDKEASRRRSQLLLLKEKGADCN